MKRSRRQSNRHSPERSDSRRAARQERRNAREPAGRGKGGAAGRDNARANNTPAGEPLPGLPARIRRHELPGHLAGLFLGLALGWQWCGTRHILDAALDPLPSTNSMFTAIALLMMSIGPRLPERVVVAVAGWFERRRGNAAPEPRARDLWVLGATAEQDRALLWVTVSLTAALAGIAAVAGFLLLWGFRVLYHEALAAFYWTNLTLAILEWTGVAVCVAGGWIMNGVLLAMVPAIRSRDRVLAPARVLAEVGLSAGAAILFYWRMQLQGMSGEQGYLLGAVPIFLLAILGAVLSEEKAENLDPGRAEPAGPPEVNPRGEGAIWTAAIIVPIAAVLGLVGWTRSLSLDLGGNSSGAYFMLIWIGLLLPLRWVAGRIPTVSGLAMTLWGTGIAYAGAVLVIAFGGEGDAWRIVQLLLLSIPTGLSILAVERAFMAAAPSPVIGFSLLATLLSAGAGIGFIFGHWAALPLLGTLGAVAAASVLLLAFSGFVQILERGQSPTAQQVRLALVFVSLAGVSLVLPRAVRSWIAREAADPIPVLAQIPLEHRASVAGRTLVITDGRLGAFGESVSRNLDVWRMRPERPGAILPIHGLRQARVSPEKYALIYQRCFSIPATRRATEYATEWFDTLLRHLRPGGAVVVDVPVAQLSSRDVLIIAAGFQQVFGPTARWSFRADDPAPQLRLEWSETPLSATEPVRLPIGTLTQGRTRGHTLNHDRLMRSLTGGVPDGSAARWLTDMARAH